MFKICSFLNIYFGDYDLVCVCHTIIPSVIVDVCTVYEFVNIGVGMWEPWMSLPMCVCAYESSREM